jgi:hypothetical protein
LFEIDINAFALNYDANYPYSYSFIDVAVFNYTGQGYTGQAAIGPIYNNPSLNISAGYPFKPLTVCAQLRNVV